jgi:hypothetical protein
MDPRHSPSDEEGRVVGERKWDRLQPETETAAQGGELQVDLLLPPTQLGVEYLLLLHSLTFPCIKLFLFFSVYRSVPLCTSQFPFDF